MSSKTRKGRKKSKPVNEVRSKDVATTKRIHAYFTNEEIAEIKSIMKTKDVMGIPFAIAATVLYKPDLLKKLLKDGYCINQTGQNNMTALMWAVKYKFLDLVDFLLSNNADPTIRTESGDNVLVLALEHKLWDEQSMIHLWKTVKKVSFIDTNFTSKNGHTMLHMCVRRDWEELLKILLLEKPNVDSANSNGVTPLMLACFRNNITIVDILIEAGADILKEDNHGRMTLCYAISSAMKVSAAGSCQYLQVTSRIIAEMRKKSFLDTYLKKRLELIVSTAKKVDISYTTSEMLIKIVHFAVQYIDEGIGIFLECEVFVQFYQVVESRLDQVATVKFLLEVCEEILFYNVKSEGFDSNLHLKVSEAFYESGFADVCLEVITTSQSELAKMAFDLLILAFQEDDRWRKLLEENCNLLLLLLTDHQNTIQDEKRAKILAEKKRKMKTIFASMESASTVLPSVEKEDKGKLDNGVGLSKKSRRKSKAIKAKLTKMKSAEFTKRLNLNRKKLIQPKTSKISNKDSAVESPEFFLEPEEVFKTKNPIVTSLQHLLEAEESRDQKFEVDDSYPKWKKQVLGMCRFDNCKNFPVNQERLSQAVDHLRNCSINFQRYDPTINRSVNIIIDYLKQLMQLMVRKYREHWDNDRAAGNCTCHDMSEHVPWLYNRHLKILEAKEREVVQEVQNNFDQLIKSIKDLAHKDLAQCLRSFNKLEATILHYEIRGTKMLSYVSDVENITMNYTTTDPKMMQNPNVVVDHVQNVLNNMEPQSEDLDIEIVDALEDVSFVETYKNETPLELYYKEMSLINSTPTRNKRKEIEAKLNTIANRFHLINSIMSLCDNDDDAHGHQKVYGVSDLNLPVQSKYQRNLQHPEITEYMPKRLKSQIASLQNAKTFQRLIGGEIRISTKEQKVNYIISAGINFSAVELGLDINNQPLAVKRIARESWVGKILKTLVDPLLGLMDNHILHYFACEYEGNELILATPLCKWNLPQYIQLLRQSSTTSPTLTTVQIVKQFLDGLMVLHKCEIPIVHGNLKPSNIFIDFNGLVKIAEFGIHKALYKIIEAPKSSLIWFAKETLDIYRNSSIVECSLKSDIQVAGMLIHFVVTYGKHPFGDNIDEILINLLRGIPKLGLRNLDLRDLLVWMMGEFAQRPDIDQVMGHPFFWSLSKKWSFIMCCCGVGQSGCLIPIDVDKLHRTIDSLEDACANFEWQEIVRNKFPNVRLCDNKNIRGLLKFVKFCHDHQPEMNLTETELSCTILSMFPVLPATLYRILQNTAWVKPAAFPPHFTRVF